MTKRNSKSRYFFQNMGSKFPQKASFFQFSSSQLLNPYFNPLNKEKSKEITKTHNFITNSYFIKIGPLIQKSNQISPCPFLCFTNHHRPNFEIAYHFPEFLHRLFKTRQMRYQCKIKVCFADIFCQLHAWGIQTARIVVMCRP